MAEECMQGLVLEDNPRNRTVFVAEVVPGGHADRSGQVEVRGLADRLMRPVYMLTENWAQLCASNLLQVGDILTKQVRLPTLPTLHTCTGSSTRQACIRLRLKAGVFPEQVQRYCSEGWERGRV